MGVGGIHNTAGQHNILVTMWKNVQNLGTMKYKLCHIIQQVLCNIQDLHIMTLPSAMTISITLHLPYIMLALFNIPEQNRTHNTSAIYSVAIL